jgi:hypothetical protein
MHFAFADTVIPLCNKTLVLTEYFVHVFHEVLRDVISTEPSFKVSTSIQSGTGVHPASCTMGTRSFPGTKQPERGNDHPPQFSAQVKEKVELYLYSPYGPLWPVLGLILPLPLTSFIVAPHYVQ